MSLLSIILCVLGFVLAVQCHMSIYVPSMWGSEPSNINSNWAVQPLQDQDFNGWWFHGTKSLNDPPPNDAITRLPAGGVLDFEITGNKAFTSMGRGLWVVPGKSPRDPPDPWSNDMHGGSSNIHAPAHADVAGCAIGIAYKSKVSEVQPNDFVIVSVVHDCIARQLQAFDFPALPACPNGRCVCAWFWIHKSVGGTDQMYMTGFQCNVTNPSKRTIGKPQVPVRCDGKPPCYLYPNWGNTTNVCHKVQTPMYWANKQGNNMQMPTNWQCAPTYSSEYGFTDGAQNQIFTNVQEISGSLGDTLFSTSEKNVITSPHNIMVSPSFTTKLAVTQEGNVILSDIETGRVHWTTGTSNSNGVAPYHLTLQKDGNLVLKDSRSQIYWESNTSNIGSGPWRLKLRDVVSLSVVDSNSEPIWVAKTA